MAIEYLEHICNKKKIVHKYYLSKHLIIPTDFKTIYELRKFKLTKYVRIKRVKMKYNFSF